MLLVRHENLELHCTCDVNDINKNVYILHSNSSIFFSNNILELIDRADLSLEDALILTKINKEFI